MLHRRQKTQEKVRFTFHHLMMINSVYSSRTDLSITEIRPALGVWGNRLKIGGGCIFSNIFSFI